MNAIATGLAIGFLNIALFWLAGIYFHGWEKSWLYQDVKADLIRWWGKKCHMT